MPLKLVLKPNDRIVLNGAVIENVGDEARLLVLNQASVMRGKDVLGEDHATTPASRVYMALQLAYLFPEQTTQRLEQYRSLARQYLEAAPSAQPIITEIESQITHDRLYPALKTCQRLIIHEAEALSTLTPLPPPEPDAVLDRYYPVRLPADS